MQRPWQPEDCIGVRRLLVAGATLAGGGFLAASQI
jgi:hypothetical protein